MIFDEKQDLIKQTYVHAKKYDDILYDYKMKGTNCFKRDDISLIAEIRREMSAEAKQLNLVKNREKYEHDKRYNEYSSWLSETVGNINGRTDSWAAFEFVNEFYMNIPKEYDEYLKRVR